MSTCNTKLNIRPVKRAISHPTNTYIVPTSVPTSIENGYTSENFWKYNQLDEIKYIRTEVERLSNRFNEQEQHLAFMQASHEMSGINLDKMDKIDILNELYQHKISLDCLEQNSQPMKALINCLKHEVEELKGLTNEQNKEIKSFNQSVKELKASVTNLTAFCQSMQSNSPSCFIIDNSATVARENMHATDVHDNQPEVMMTVCENTLRSSSCSELRHNYVNKQKPSLGTSRFIKNRRATQPADSRPPVYAPSTRSLALETSRSESFSGSNTNSDLQKFRRSLKSIPKLNNNHGNDKIKNLTFFLKSPRLALKRSSLRLHLSKKVLNEETNLHSDLLSCTSISDAHRPLSGSCFRSRLSLLIPTSVDFEVWNVDSVCNFFVQLGLGYSVASVRKCIKSGLDIINASTKMIEQEFGITKPLHIKKLLIHVSLRTTKELATGRQTSFVRKINPCPDFTISSWLEDLGLLMYLEVFEIELVDAYVLNELTLGELYGMNITNELHMLSLRRGLQILRRIDFDLTCLCRRPFVLPVLSNKAYFPNCLEEKKSSPNVSIFTDLRPNSFDANNQPSTTIMTDSAISFNSTKSLPNSQNNSSSPIDEAPVKNTKLVSLGSDSCLNISSNTIRDKSLAESCDDLCFWSFHRLEVWLHEIELPEYVSNLRGSGLNGALFVYEDRFTADTLASVLDISVNKSLLRRHLTNKFAALLGDCIWARKKAISARQDFIPLCIFSKFKTTTRRSIFSSSKKRGVVYMDSDLLCPMEAEFDFDVAYESRANQHTNHQ